MNLKDHLSAETLDLFLADELSDEVRSLSALHLSYCPICRDQKNALNLNLAAERMWREFDAAAVRETHIEENIFRDFWLDKISDEKFLNQLSHHCIACRDCRSKREQVRLKIRKEQLQVGAWVRLLAALATQKRRRRLLYVAVSLVGLFLLIKFWPIRQTPAPHAVKNDATHAPLVAPAPVAPDSNSSSPPKPEVPNSPKPSQKAIRRVPEPRELLAQVQEVDLTSAGDVAEYREPDSNTRKTVFTIVALRSGPTRLRILLPVHSRRGVYDVSIRDSAFLAQLVSAKSESSNGVNISALIDLRELKADDYILRITRRDPTTGHEYIGDYNIRIIDSKSTAP